MVPSFISVLITSAALTAILCARSPTEMVSGTSTSRTIGSAGIWAGWTSSAWRWRPRGPPRQPAAPPAASPRVLMPRRLAASSFQAVEAGFLAFLSSGLTAGLCSVPLGAASPAFGAAFSSSAFLAASSAAFCICANRSSASCFARSSRSCRSLISFAWIACSSAWRWASSSRSRACSASITGAEGETGGATSGVASPVSRLTSTRFLRTSTWMVRALPDESAFLISLVWRRVRVILVLACDSPCERRR